LWQASADNRVEEPQSFRQISRRLRNQVPIAAKDLPELTPYANIGAAKNIWSSEKL
jgi:hypothetical protein